MMKIRDTIVLFVFGCLVVLGAAFIADNGSANAGPDAPSFLEWWMTVD